jgi:hypothetical protein
MLPSMPPHTAIMRDAEAMCTGLTASVPWLQPHSLRAFDLARWFAAARGIGAALDPGGVTSGPSAGAVFDVEVLWVAAMLHDVGLVQDPPRAADCFAVRSADVARGLASSHDWDSARTTRLMTAITSHVNVRVPRELSLEGHLLNAGTSLDVTGIGLGEIDSDQVRVILHQARQPGFGAELADTWKADARRHRNCRSAALRWIGLTVLMRHWP